jgi:hypothetical protein
MYSIARLRQHPHFAPFFAHVHPLCWLILWWELNRLMRWFKAHGIGNALYSVNEWGFVDIHCVVAKPDPNAYKPAQRTFRPLTDPSWESAVPACLDTEATPEAILPRFARKISPQATQGGSALTALDTS